MITSSNALRAFHIGRILRVISTINFLVVSFALLFPLFCLLLSLSLSSLYFSPAIYIGALINGGSSGRLPLLALKTRRAISFIILSRKLKEKKLKRGPEFDEPGPGREEADVPEN